jgi:hypothetical protein
MLGHNLAARCSGVRACSERISIIAAGRPLQLRPDEECTLDRGGELDQFSGRITACSVMFFRMTRISPSDRKAV